MIKHVNGVDVELTREEKNAILAEWAANEVRKNTRAAREEERETLAAAREKATDDVILSKSNESGAAKVYKDAAAILRSRNG